MTEDSSFSLLKDIQRCYLLITDLFSNVVNDCKSMIGEKQISIITELNTKTIKTIYCDEKRVEQVFLNLIKNSIDFVPEKDGKIILRVDEEYAASTLASLSAIKKPNWNISNPYCIFTVKDNGKGIS